MRRNIILSEKSYTFSDYFIMRWRTDEVLNYFGYIKQNEQTKLPSFSSKITQLQSLADKIKEVLIHIMRILVGILEGK